MDHHRIAVQAGQYYRVARANGPARHVRVSSVSQGWSPKGNQPKAFLVEVTCNGQRKGPKTVVARRTFSSATQTESTERVTFTVPHWLTWDVERKLWVMGAQYTLVDLGIMEPIVTTTADNGQRRATSVPRNDITATESLCTKCKTVKPIDEFTRDRSRKIGVSCWCKVCDKAHLAKRAAERAAATGGK